MKYIKDIRNVPGSVELPNIMFAYRNENFFHRELRTTLQDLSSQIKRNHFNWNAHKIYDYLVQRAKPLRRMGDEEVEVAFVSMGNGYSEHMSGPEFLSISEKRLPIVWNEYQAMVSVHSTKELPRILKVSAGGNNSSKIFSQYLKTEVNSLIKQPSDFDDARQCVRYESDLTKFFHPNP